MLYSELNLPVSTGCSMPKMHKELSRGGPPEHVKGHGKLAVCPVPCRQLQPRLLHLLARYKGPPSVPGGQQGLAAQLGQQACKPHAGLRSPLLIARECTLHRMQHAQRAKMYITPGVLQPA